MCAIVLERFGGPDSLIINEQALTSRRALDLAPQAYSRPAGHRGEATVKDTARRTGERVRPRSRRREAHASIGEV
jgi:hypothetical protein